MARDAAGARIDLLRTLPAWTLRLLFPVRISRSIDSFVAVVREELATPLRPEVIRVLHEHFEQSRSRRTT